MSNSTEEIENLLINILKMGVTGTYKDYCSWLKLNHKLNLDLETNFDPELVLNALNNLKEKGVAVEGKFDKKEFRISDSYSINSPLMEDKFYVLGGAEFSPIQYVRSRQEYFLEINKVLEEDIIDISIATIEAIENAVKYGDGKIVELEQRIDSNRNYKINIINNIKEFDLTDEIERGKYSSNITLMRGVMIMQKLFNHLDIQIIDEKKQAHLYAEKKLN
jgi:anti-sigma regulatory factor (Ser/Thr protein kinase)